ncbi:hypothetical protein [Pseudomonas sp. C32]|uniref:hypothetical protein n=1 Tax=Pseudomonas sp. C32 TaxID=1529208 RepID=UPI00260736DA|nr:hypothetical protein [Pseudomonas sp. C32]MDN4547185.1 hypothetical protein [Pseudomonas sp. C32]
MINLHIHFGRKAEASLLFEGTTAVRMKLALPLAPWNPALDIHDVIRALETLKEQVLEFTGRHPDRLTVHRPPRLPLPLLERLEAASFAAGFNQFEPVDLGDLVQVLSSSAPSTLLLIHASRDMISGVTLSTDACGATFVREAVAAVDEVTLENRMLTALKRESASSAACPLPPVHELIGRYWGACEPQWSFDMREWTSIGWATATFGSADVTAIDEVTAGALRKLLGELAPTSSGAEVALIGEGAPRVSVLIKYLSPGLRIVSPSVTGIVDAMIARSRSLNSAVARQGTMAEKPGIRLVFDPHTDLETNAMPTKRDSTSVRVACEADKFYRLNHIPAKWHRIGFGLEIQLAEQSKHVEVFKDQISVELRTFSVLIGSRWPSASSLLLSIAIPEIGSSALIVFRAGREPVVTYYPAK